MTAFDFLRLSERELAAYERALAERGRSAHIEVDEDCDLKVGSGHLGTLCGLLIDGHLSPNMLAYIAEVLQFAERVECLDASLMDVFAEFTDPEADAAFIRSRAREIVTRGNA